MTEVHNTTEEKKDLCATSKADEKIDSLTASPKKHCVQKRKGRGEPRWLIHASEYSKRPKKVVYDSSSEEENIPKRHSEANKQSDSHNPVKNSTVTSKVRRLPKF